MKELTEGMALLFESALEPVIGTDGENIVLMNPAAVSAFGDHRGAEFSALLPEAVRALAPGQVAAVTLCGKRASLRAASAGGLTVYFAAVEAPAPALPERAGFLPELRSLISALKLAADRLSDSAEAAGDAAGTERAAIVQHTCAQLQRLVGNASLAGDIESGSVSFRPESLNLDELCRSTTWTAEFFARSRGIEVVYSGPDEPVWIGADRVMMEILLLNLISNSLLHLREGGRLEVSLTRRGGRIVLAVDDTGSGMTQQELSPPLHRRGLGPGHGAQARARHSRAARRRLHNRGPRGPRRLRASHAPERHPPGQRHLPQHRRQRGPRPHGHSARAARHLALVQGLRPQTLGLGGRNMRLDKYLKVSRLIKRRTVANEACDGGRVSLNGKTAKAGSEVKPGDIIEVAFGQRSLKVEVLSVSETAAKADAPAMYRELV